MNPGDIIDLMVEHIIQQFFDSTDDLSETECTNNETYAKISKCIHTNNTEIIASDRLKNDNQSLLLIHDKDDKLKKHIDIDHVIDNWFDVFDSNIVHLSTLIGNSAFGLHLNKESNTEFSTDPSSKSISDPFAGPLAEPFAGISNIKQTTDSFDPDIYEDELIILNITNTNDTLPFAL